MNYLTIQALVETHGYEVEYMSMTYSTNLIPMVSIGLKKGEETLNFNLRCHVLEDLAGEAQSLAGFMDWLAMFMERKELKNNG